MEPKDLCQEAQEGYNLSFNGQNELGHVIVWVDGGDFNLWYKSREQLIADIGVLQYAADVMSKR